MLVGDIVPGTPEWATSVTVNGVERAVRSVSWENAMAGDLPDQVVASGGVGGASGTIVWASQSPVSDRPVSPWHKPAGWPPSAGDRVQVRVSDGVTTWVRFTGVIDSTTGDPNSGFQSKIIDFRDRISGTVNLPALLRYMPPYVEDGDYRRVGLSNWWPLMMALRQAGIFNTPPMESLSMVSAPLQGSVWPEIGDLASAEGLNGASHAEFYSAPWGYAATNFTATFYPNRSRAVDASEPIQLSMMVAPDHSTTGEVSAVFGATRVRLRVNGDRQVFAHWVTGSGATQVAALSANQFGDSQAVSLLVKGSAWEVRASNGATATGTQARPTGQDLSSVIVTSGSGSRIAGVQVSSPTSSTQEHRATRFVPDARFVAPGIGASMNMSPAIRGRAVRDLVGEIASATLNAMWWDETGTLRIVPAIYLRGQDAVQTITTLDDITSLEWEDSALSVRSAVEVAWKNPAISKGRQYRLELWRGPEESMLASDDPTEQFVTPPTDTEWFGVDRTVGKLDSTNWGAYNSRSGSYAGVRFEDSTGAEVTTPANGVTVKVDVLAVDSIKITTTIGSMPTSFEAVTATPHEEQALYPKMRGQALPVVRGMGRGEWIDDEYRVTAGPASASVLRHELGYWGHEYFEGGSAAQRIGDWLASMVSAPLATITGMGVIYDPRRQLGDVYTVRSDWLGIELRVLVVGLSESHGEGAHQSLTVRVIRATNLRGVTYDDLSAAWDTGNYASLQAAWAALTYDDMAANPLEGAPS